MMKITNFPMISNSKLLLLLLCFCIEVSAIVEPGYQIFNFELEGTKTKVINFTKSMYIGTDIIIKIGCDNANDDANFKMDALLLFNKCHQPDELEYPFREANAVQANNLSCHKSVIIPKEDLDKIIGHDIQSTSLPQLAEHEENGTLSDTTKTKKVGENMLPPTKHKALYRLKLGFTFYKDADKGNFEVRIEAKRNGGYLSVFNWPLLPFFGVMSLVYLAFAIGWFVASCCNWRDLLRVQFWIGGVIAIGMFENALFYSEYQNINHNGQENGLLYFAEIVSCVKRALARILVIIVSMGFGIVKPRLGQMLHKVIAIGTIYFILAAIEGCIRVRDIRLSKTHMYAFVPLTVLDVGLCWWIFSSLVQTTRTLRIRKNVVKLTLYHHFTNTLIFTVLASLAYMAWTIKQTKFTNCIDIGTLWLNDALWPFLFALILAVIMVLWRPSNNNQRYAFTPLDLGDSEDDEDDMTLSDAFEGMKMRNKSETQNGSAPKSKKKAEEDLKWVEENIPSVPPTLLPTIDSDEEIMTTKFEISKMD